MNIAIWGMGISGVSALKYLATTDHNLYVINDGPVENWVFAEQILKSIPKEKCISEDKLDPELSLDQIILAPGIDRKKPLVKSFIDRGIEVISEIELAYRHIKIPIVAITGTNGKTTTATMMELAFSKTGKKVFLGGNIGVPFCDILLDDTKYDLAVLELSSFQLESIKDFRANVGIILNITESHMERYHQFKDYAEAKLNIVKNQQEGDLFICPVKYLGTKTEATKSCIAKIRGLDFSHSKLIGEHHKENLFCIEKSLEHFGVKNSTEILQELVNEFSGVKFRLQYEGEHKGLVFINDGKSTNIDATMSAIKTFDETELYLILGGKLRTNDISFINQLDEFEINAIYCFGEAGPRLSKELSVNFKTVICKNLEEVFEKIKKDISVGTILFSPAFPSFDLYSNYVERGEHFKKLVNSLSN